MGRRTVERLALSGDANVLDVGCGTGASGLPAAEAVGPNGFVIGVDLSSRLLDRARAKATAHGLTNVEFSPADMTALGYPPARRFPPPWSVEELKSLPGTTRHAATFESGVIRK
jgi:ubiquinone/menaquinone biosynthesis C-methylase UbiE